MDQGKAEYSGLGRTRRDASLRRLGGSRPSLPEPPYGTRSVSIIAMPASATPRAAGEQLGLRFHWHLTTARLARASYPTWLYMLLGGQPAVDTALDAFLVVSATS